MELVTHIFRLTDIVIYYCLCYYRQTDSDIPITKFCFIKSRQYQVVVTKHAFLMNCWFSVSELGDFCQTGGNCLLKDGTFGNCIAGKCDCKYDRQVPTEDAMSCVEARNLGEICENDDQCSFIPNAVCRVSCRCAAGYALSRDGTRCLEGI